MLEIIFPRKCLGCGLLPANNHGTLVCNLCLSKIPLKAGFVCIFCDAPVVDGKICPFCKKAGAALDKFISATDYGKWLTETLIKTAKYRFAKSAAQDMAMIMEKYLKEKRTLIKLIRENDPIIVPIPLHPQRLRWRGYNQSEFIAKRLGASLGIKLAPEIITRSVNRQPQAGIKDRTERIANIKNVFFCLSPSAVLNKKIILIDDVSTTGATLNEAAKTLKLAGAKEVIGFAFAKGKAGTFSPKLS